MSPYSSFVTPVRLSIALVLVAACDAGSTEDERCLAVSPDAVLRSARADNEEQGMTLQGTQWQGGDWQGISQQGIETQGLDYQGAALAESALDGLRLALADGSPVTMRDGRLTAEAFASADALRGVELVATSSAAQRFALTIASVTDVGGTEHLEIVAGGAHVCAPGKAGMFVPGSWDDTGVHALAGDELTYACMDGVIAKCVAWGYAPWLVGADVHQTCTRLARADYCGDGHPWTMNGTMIDVYDTLGVQTPVHDPELSFEAAWNEDGAVCVNATRYDITNAEGDTILPECFAALPRCTSLAAASELGADLANDSAHTPIEACGG